MPRSDMTVLQTSAGGEVILSCWGKGLEATYTGSPQHAVYIALQGVSDQPPGGDVGITGSSIVPYAQHFEGSTVLLPFDASLLYGVVGDHRWKRAWNPYQWSDQQTDCAELSVHTDASNHLVLTLDWPAAFPTYRIAIYIKDLRENSGWGSLLGSCDASLAPGWGDRAIESYLEVSPAGDQCQISLQARFQSASRERIYELFVRLFGNRSSRRTVNGTLAENGCGKFADINPAAIHQIAAMGFTHIWLMGVVRHASTTGYALPGLEADETDLMKGLAGSPYAIKDYFDVDPDLALDPAQRLSEFAELVSRIHSAGLKVLIDYVGNHVSRAYRSHIRPELTFGDHDDVDCFFAPRNNFFYLGRSDAGTGPPLHLPTYDPETRQPISPTCAVKNDCNGLFAGEMTIGRVTGNNAITWNPSLHDWYETVKLNYGFEFTGRYSPQRAFPHVGNTESPLPDTWLKMDAVLAHWQKLGIDGFRCDMAHMLPPEFWAWSIARARMRNPQVFFMAEAYNDYFTVNTTAPEVLALGGQPLFSGLLHAGFNAVYGHDVYRVIKELYDGSKWANDIDALLGNEHVFNHSVHYAENHDEIRLASPYAWGAVGSAVGRAASAVLFGMGRGPILFYSGQEVGEPAVEAEGFSGADGRTTLFDYWSLPELSKWADGGTFDGAHLSDDQKALRAFYSRLIAACGQPAFSQGQFLSLNPFNIDNPAAGRLPGEPSSGHWFYAFLRYDRASKQRVLAVANFHEFQAFTSLHLHLPEPALHFLELDTNSPLRLTEYLGAKEFTVAIEHAGSGVDLGTVPPLTPYFFSIERLGS